jgi:hypothetical protein
VGRFKDGGTKTDVNRRSMHQYGFPSYFIGGIFVMMCIKSGIIQGFSLKKKKP